MSVTPRTHEGISLPDQGPFDIPLGINEVEEFPRLLITPNRHDYVRVPFQEGFDVPAVLSAALEAGELPIDSALYKVDFASLRKADADILRLSELDTGAHREAVGSEGFLLYFRGDADKDGFNRSWCIWRSPQEAYEATHHKPAHLEAMAAVDEMYDWYEVTMEQMWLDASLPAGYDSRLIKTASTGAAPYLLSPEN